jgi:hypothetical protein
MCLLEVVTRCGLPRSSDDVKQLKSLSSMRSFRHPKEHSTDEYKESQSIFSSEWKMENIRRIRILNRLYVAAQLSQYGCL